MDIQRLDFAGDLWFVLVNPKFEAPTAEMRAVLPKEVPMQQVVRNSSMGASLVRVWNRKCVDCLDLSLLGCFGFSF